MFVCCVHINVLTQTLAQRCKVACSRRIVQRDAACIRHRLQRGQGQTKLQEGRNEQSLAYVGQFTDQFDVLNESCSRTRACKMICVGNS